MTSLSKLKAEKIKEFEEKFSVMLYRYTMPYPNKQGEEMIDEVFKFLSEALDSIQEEMVKEIHKLKPDSPVTANWDWDKGYYYAKAELLELLASGKEEKE